MFEERDLAWCHSVSADYVVNENQLYLKKYFFVSCIHCEKKSKKICVYFLSQWNNYEWNTFNLYNISTEPQHKQLSIEYHTIVRMF